MDTSKLYYLSHPYTSYGDKEENRNSAAEIEEDLVNRLGVSVINPICLPLGDNDEIAMAKCRHLYNACDAVIFCENWEKSKGCSEEHAWAMADGKPCYRYSAGVQKL